MCFSVYTEVETLFQNRLLCFRQFDVSLMSIWLLLLRLWRTCAWCFLCTIYFICCRRCILCRGWVLTVVCINVILDVVTYLIFCRGVTSVRFFIVFSIFVGQRCVFAWWNHDILSLFFSTSVLICVGLSTQKWCRSVPGMFVCQCLSCTRGIVARCWFSKQWIRCFLIFDWSYITLSGSISWKVPTAYAIVNNPQSVLPACLWHIFCWSAGTESSGENNCFIWFIKDWVGSILKLS